MASNPAKRQFLRLVFPFWLSRHRHCVTILMLHGVMDAEAASASWLPLRPNVSPGNLETALKVLSRWYRFVSLDHAVAMLEGRRPPEPNCMVLTFDDGYRNNLTHALPILRRHGAPMTMFLPTGHITRREPFWYDRLDFALQRLPRPRTISWGAWSARVDPADREGLRKKFATFREVFKRGSEPHPESMRRLEEFLSGLERDAGSRLQDLFERDPWTSLLDWGSVREMAASGVEFGSHTVDHAFLTNLDDAAVTRQLSESSRDLAAHTGRECVHLCYPNGFWSLRVVELARQIGYRSAVTTMPGVSRPGCADLLLLRRNALPASNDGTTILANASGLTANLDRRRGTRGSGGSRG